MKAQVLYKEGPLESRPLVYEEVEIPIPKKFEVRLRVLACGICLTDKHIIEGELAAKKFPLIPGHQIVGVIDAVGDGITTWKVGARVGVPWLHATCGTCYYCGHGLENLCERGEFTGYDVDGGYAEYAIAQEDYLVEIPKEIDDSKAAPLLCAGIVGYRSYIMAGVSAGGRLGLFGFGAAAHIMLQVAHLNNVEVYVFTRSAGHQELARKMGAAFVGKASDEAPHLLDSAIIFAPSGELLPHALKSIRPGGLVIFNAIHSTPIPEMDYSLIYKERTVKTVANATRSDAKEFMAIASKIEVAVVSYPLVKANEALLDVKHSRINGSCILYP